MKTTAAVARRASAILLVLVVASCSSGGGGEPGTAKSTPAIETNGTVVATVDGVGSVYTGTVENVRASDITALKAKDDAPRVEGTLDVGPGMSVDIRQPFTGQFEVRLQLPPAPSARAIPAAIHMADDGSVQVEPGLWDPKTNELVLWTASFSDRWGAWFDPRNWIEEVVQVGQGAFDFVADFITGRTDPPACAEPPTWSTVQAIDASSLHVCLQANPASDGTERAELYLASNRRTAQLVTTSPTRDYLWVQNQPDAYSAALAALARVPPGSNVVLLGDHAMSMGFRRPQFSADQELRAYQTWPIVIANPLLAALGNLPLKGTLALFAAVGKCLAEFSGIDVTRLDVIPDGGVSAPEFLGQMVRCAFEVIQQPELAIGVAAEALNAAGVTGTTRSAALSNIRAGLQAIGPTAARVGSKLAVGSVLTNTWDGIFDNLAEGRVVLHLEGKLSDASIAALARCARCSVTGRVDLDHPAWGRVHIFSLGPTGTACSGVELLAVDDNGAERWRHTIEPECYYKLEPAENATSVPALPRAVDAAGHAFFYYDPGRYNGVIILSPTVNGFDDFGTLPTRDNYDARFYYAYAVDDDGDGTYEVHQAYNDCLPTCADGADYETTYAWNGADYAAILPQTEVACGRIGFAAQSDALASDIRALRVTCADARAALEQIARGHNFHTGPKSFQSAGWACSVVVNDGALRSGDYTCTRGDAQIRWHET